MEPEKQRQKLETLLNAQRENLSNGYWGPNLDNQIRREVVKSVVYGDSSRARVLYQDYLDEGFIFYD